MARVFPFQPYRYSVSAGALEKLLTQPYDKITPAMQARYLSLSPYNLVRIVLGERFPSDSESDNVYTRAARHLEDWIARGVLVREPEPAIFPYFQEFPNPDGGEGLLRKGFIALGALEDYSAGVVHRHEQTLSGPKKDRLELLRHTRAHCGQIFMLYPDQAGEIDRLLDGAAKGEPLASVCDEYGALHRMWKMSNPAVLQQLMSDKKLLIADGHHRYETALAYRQEEPAADKVMMTFVNAHSPDLTILATHRLVRGVTSFDAAEFLRAARETFEVAELGSLDALRRAWASEAGDRARFGVVTAGGLWLLQAPRNGRLHLDLLHRELIEGALRISADAVRDEQHLGYVRGLDRAAEEVRRGAAQIAFLVEPVAIGDVMRVAFSGGVMPQKSTDFYPKLLSGLAIHKL